MGFSMTNQERAIFRKVGRIGGKTAAANMSAEARKRRARKAGLASADARRKRKAQG
jgi:hypothetical protein